MDIGTAATVVGLMNGAFSLEKELRNRTQTPTLPELLQKMQTPARNIELRRWKFPSRPSTIRDRIMVQPRVAFDGRTLGTELF